MGVQCSRGDQCGKERVQQVQASPLFVFRVSFSLSFYVIWLCLMVNFVDMFVASCFAQGSSLFYGISIFRP